MAGYPTKMEEKIKMGKRYRKGIKQHLELRERLLIRGFQVDTALLIANGKIVNNRKSKG